MKAGLPFPLWRIALAWCVHLYTALGLVCAAGMAVLLFEGGESAFRRVFWLMLLATLIDATDGTFARMVRIKEVLPGFDGRKLDDLIDYLTYVVMPLLLIWRAELLPAGMEGWLLFPLLASAYGFCQTEAKTGEGHFLGFPSYWNLVAFYLYALRPLPGWFNLGCLLLLAVLVFVPTLYIYPTQKGLVNRLTWVLSVPWTLLLAGVLWWLPEQPASESWSRWLALVSLGFPLYYFVASLAVTWAVWRRQ